MYTRDLQPPEASFFLLGPRGTGKTTWIRAHFPQAASYDLLRAEEALRFARDPGAFGRECRALPAEAWIVVDEVQRVPALLDEAQQLMSERRQRFVLSGSSARKLRRGQANLLPGRVHVHRLAPLVAKELGADFDIERALAHGMLPGVWSDETATERAADLRSYADSYLREEIQAEALVRDVGAYARLLEHVAAASGRVLNLHALSGDAGIPYETARRHVEVLEDTLVAFRVPAWSGSDRASLIAHPRIFLFDAGVRNALLRRPLDRPHDDDRGVLLEHLVAMELHARVGTLLPEARLFHYRTRHGAEVDFVLELGRETWGIEVKASRDVSSGALSGLASLAERLPSLKRRIVVFLGARARRVGDVDVLPLRQFVDELG